MNCFLCTNLNAQETVKFLLNEKDITFSPNLVEKVYDWLRDTISKYSYVVFETENLAEENAGGYFSVDESMFGH